MSYTLDSKGGQSFGEGQLLNSRVDSAVHHLQMRLKQQDPEDIQFEFGEVKRIAPDLVDIIDQLRKHEDQHQCDKQEEEVLPSR